MVRIFNFFRESSHPHIIAILKEIPNEYNSECHDIATVYAVKSSKPSNQTVWITARDSISGMVVKCDAKVGRIHKLSLFTNYVQISVDEINSLQVMAYDQYGAGFSSVSGLSFKWDFSTNDKGSLKFVQPSDTLQLATESSLKMEKENKMTDVSFLKGIKTGLAEVKVTILEDGYSSVLPAMMNISVIEPFSILPSYPIYILPHSTYPYTLVRI
jgi:hypothetical protein